MSPQIGPHNSRGLGLHVLPDYCHHRGGQAPGDHHVTQVTGLLLYLNDILLQNYKGKNWMFSIDLADWLARTIARHSLGVQYSIHARHCSDQAPGSADVSPRHSRHLQSSVGSSVCKVQTALTWCYNGTWAIEQVVKFSFNECYLIIRRRS